METWKDIPDYEGLYQVSDLGRVKTLGRKRIMPNGGINEFPEKILKQGKDSRGYLYVVLCKNGNRKTSTTHRLVWGTFNGETDLPIDHIVEGNKLDNRLSNLQALSSRENTIKYHKSKNNSSKYTGVSWHKRENKWGSSITINGKKKHLGYFITEYEAHLAYENKLKSLI